MDPLSQTPPPPPQPQVCSRPPLGAERPSPRLVPSIRHARARALRPICHVCLPLLQAPSLCCGSPGNRAAMGGACTAGGGGAGGGSQFPGGTWTCQLPPPPPHSTFFLPLSCFCRHTRTCSWFILIGEAEPDSYSRDGPTLQLHDGAQGCFQSGGWLLGLCSVLGWLSGNESLKARERGLFRRRFLWPQHSLLVRILPRWRGLGDLDALLVSPSPSFHMRDKGGASTESRSHSQQGRELRKEMEEEVPPLLGAG